MAVDAELLNQLRSVPLFEDLSDQEMRDVSARFRVVEHQAGHDVVVEGHGAAGFHLILEGNASVHHGDQTVGQLGAGDYFGEISLIDGKPRSATIRSDSPMRTFSLSAVQFQPLLDSQPGLTHKILLGLCRTIRTLEGSRRADPPA